MRLIDAIINFFGKIFPFNSKYWKFFWNSLNEGWIRLYKLILVLIIITDFVIFIDEGFVNYYPSDGNFIIYLFILAFEITLCTYLSVSLYTIMTIIVIWIKEGFNLKNRVMVKPSLNKRSNIFHSRIFIIVISKLFGCGSMLLFILVYYDSPYLTEGLASALYVMSSADSMNYWFNQSNVWSSGFPNFSPGYPKVLTFKIIHSSAISFLIFSYIYEYFLNYFIRKRNIKLIFLKLIVLCFLVNKFIVSYSNPFWFFSSFLILCFVIDTIHFLYFKYSSKN